MGKKKEAVAAPPPPPPKEEDEDEVEDTPAIKQMKAIDEKYCAVEVELEREIEKLRLKYDERQAPLMEERRTVLNDASACSAEEAAYGTPGCPGFWAEALSNAPDIEECLHECDEPVMKYLHDIKASYLDPEAPTKGGKVEFFFKENPFFTNDVLWFEAHYDYTPETYKPYKECDVIEVKGCTIEWKPGKDVTVEKKAKEVKGKKGSKKAGKVKEEPQPSFFRILFTNVKRDAPLPDALECVYSEEDGDEDEKLEEAHLDNMDNVWQFMKEQFIRYAVRYYTGEAADDEDDDDEESEEESDDDDDDDDDESEDEPPARGRSGNKKGGKPPPAAKKGDADGAAQKTEECKQQ